MYSSCSSKRNVFLCCDRHLLCFSDVKAQELCLYLTQSVSIVCSTFRVFKTSCVEAVVLFIENYGAIFHSHADEVVKNTMLFLFSSENAV